MNPEKKLTEQASLNHYQRVFGEAGPTTFGDDEIRKLASSMTSSSNENSDSDIPAGFTYLGQFINHEISLIVPSHQPRSLDELENLRDPSPILQTLYGGGPNGDRRLYEADGISLKLGLTSLKPRIHFDLPRQTGDTPLPDIVDVRNDENLAVAQLQVLLIKFHNAVVKHFGLAGSAGFNEAKRTVVHHFQSIVIHDYLRRLIDSRTFSELLGNTNNPFSITHGNRFLPAEYLFAAFRFGHAMSRRNYVLNLLSAPPEKFDLYKLFDFVGSRHFTRCSYDKKNSLPALWAIDWRLFFDYPRQPNLPKNMAKKITPALAPDLAKLRRTSSCTYNDNEFSIAELDLRAGFVMDLYSGQDIALQMNSSVVPPEVVEQWIPAHLRQRFRAATPLWVYVLAEADHFEAGERLGPVGSLIVGATLFGVTRSAPISVFDVPEFNSVFGKATFSMTEMLEFIEDVEGTGALDPFYGGA